MGKSKRTVWAIWNVTGQFWFSISLRLEVYEEDEAFCMACAFTASAPTHGPVWRAVEMTMGDAEKIAADTGLLGVYDCTGKNRRTRAWAA